MTRRQAVCEALAIEVVEEFCEAHGRRRHGYSYDIDEFMAFSFHSGTPRALSDDELLSSAWEELPAEKCWTPVVWSSETGRWSVVVRKEQTFRRLTLDEPAMIAKYRRNWSLKQIGAEHGCSDMTVREVLLRNGIKCRSLSDSHRGCGAFGRRGVRLDEAKVWDLRVRGLLRGETWKSLAKAFGVSFTAARSAGLGLTWTHVPMPGPAAEGGV